MLLYAVNDLLLGVTAKYLFKHRVPLLLYLSMQQT